MRQKKSLALITASAWLSIAAIAYATLTHVGFVYAIYFKLAPILMRPEMRVYALYEHVIAFAVAGFLFSVAYPRHAILVGCFIVGVAALLETLQMLTPDRHATLIDALQKMAGGIIGVVLAKALIYFRLKRMISSVD